MSERTTTKLWARRPGAGGSSSALWRSPNARRLLVISLIDSAGNGAFTSASVVLFSTVLGLSSVQIGQGIALGGALGLACSIAWGALADRLGARTVLIALQLWRAAGFVAYAFVGGFPAYLAVVVFVSIAERASPPVLLSFVTSAVGEEDRVRTAGALRSIRNAGFTLGALLASVALLFDGRAPLLAIVLGNAASFLIAVLLLRRIRLRDGGRPIRRPKGAAVERVLRRPAFLGATAMSGVLSIHRSLLAVGLPLWIVTRDLAPRSLISILIAVNTAMVVVLQVRLTRPTEKPDGAQRVLRWTGWLLLLFCALLALTEVDLPGGELSTVAVLVLAAVTLTFAEMWQASGAWALSLALSPESARGRYLAVFNLGPSLLDIVGALLLTAWVLAAGGIGWLVLGVVLAAAGQLAGPVARWAERERAATEVEKAAAGGPPAG